MKLILLGKNGEEGTAIVDDKDYKRLNKYEWHYDDFARYPYTSKKWDKSKGTRLVRMHRMLIKTVPKGMQVDHKNRNRFDNRRENLRFCTQNQQMQNRPKIKRQCTSPHKGIYLLKEVKLWRAGITADHKYYFLGKFESERDAAIAYNGAARVLHGEFACLNEV